MFKATVWVGTVLGTLLIPLVADKPVVVLCTAGWSIYIATVLWFMIRCGSGLIRGQLTVSRAVKQAETVSASASSGLSSEGQILAPVVC